MGSISAMCCNEHGSISGLGDENKSVDMLKLLNEK